MPIIARIKGTIIRMFYKDHPPPHFHATNNEHNGLFDINTLEMWNNQQIKKIEE